VYALIFTHFSGVPSKISFVWHWKWCRVFGV